MWSTHKQTPDSEGASIHYDGFTIFLHWLTFALVILLFALAEIWGFLEHGTSTRKGLQSLHISLGMALAAVVVIRLIWRAVAGRHFVAAREGHIAWAAKAMHSTLYLLLVTQIVTGFLYRWAQAESFMFFGLFPVRFATSANIASARAFDDVHEFIAWTIIILVSFHSAAALLHHYACKDNVLRKMLPKFRISR